MTDASRANFWRAALLVAPLLAAAVPFFGTLLLGGFDDFQVAKRDKTKKRL